MASSVLSKSLAFCKLFGALDNLVNVRHRFEEVVAQAGNPFINREKFLTLFAIAPMLADHVFNMFDTFHQDKISYSHFLLALCVFSDADDADKINLICDVFNAKQEESIHRPELIHILDTIIDSACNLMGINIHDPSYMLVADHKARDIASVFIQRKDNRCFGDCIYFNDLYALVGTSDAFDQLRDFVLDIAVRSSILLRSNSMTLQSCFFPEPESPETSSSRFGSSDFAPEFSSICIHRMIFPEYRSKSRQYDSFASLDRAWSWSSGWEQISAICDESCTYECRCGSSNDDGRSNTTYVDPANLQGYVYKQTLFLRRLKRRWLVLRNNMLYSFHHEHSPKPNIVISLAGAICDPVDVDCNSAPHLIRDQNKPRFAFQIESSLSHLTRIVYLHTAEQRDCWVEAIRIASRDFNLSDHYHISSVVHPCLPNVFECKGAYTGERYMVKYIDKYMVQETDLHALRIESGVLRFANHADVAATVALYEDNDKIYIIRRYIPCWLRLDEIIRSFGVLSINSVALIMKQVVSGLRFLHTHGLVLGAFGPANIVLRLDALKQHRIQLVDVGLRKFFVSSLDSETRCYIAPEIEKGEGAGPKADMWSVGAIIYRLLTTRSTYRDVNSAKQHELDLSRTKGSKEIRTFLKRLLSRNPSRRYCAADTLKSSWIANAQPAPFRLNLPSYTGLVQSLCSEGSTVKLKCQQCQGCPSCQPLRTE